MISDQQFKQASALLKRHAPPDVWENFVGALTAYSFREIGAVVDAGTDTVILAQGIARGTKKLLMLIQECEPTQRGTP